MQTERDLKHVPIVYIRPSNYFFYPNMAASTHPVRSPLSAIDPGHRDVLQDHHHSERQTSGVVVKHGDKVVP